MDINDLNKTQLLLLTILVNFITSIAVSVLTVSLLDETAPTISQTVNRIVDHTIETVTTQTPSKPSTSSEPSEQDLLVAAIALNTSHAASLYAYATTSAPVIGGIYVPSRRGVVTFTNQSLLKTMYVGLPNGTYPQATQASLGDQFALYRFPDTVSLPDASAPNFVASKNLKQGQRVIGLTQNGSVVVGIITKIDGAGIATDLPSVPVGSPVVNISGEFIGMASSGGRVVPAEQISSFLASIAQ